jgi:hypothetical protein
MTAVDGLRGLANWSNDADGSNQESLPASFPTPKDNANKVNSLHIPIEQRITKPNTPEVTGQSRCSSAPILRDLPARRRTALFRLFQLESLSFDSVDVHELVMMEHMHPSVMPNEASIPKEQWNIPLCRLFHVAKHIADKILSVPWQTYVEERSIPEWLLFDDYKMTASIKRNVGDDVVFRPYARGQMGRDSICVDRSVLVDRLLQLSPGDYLVHPDDVTITHSDSSTGKRSAHTTDSEYSRDSYLHAGNTDSDCESDDQLSGYWNPSDMSLSSWSSRSDADVASAKITDVEGSESDSEQESVSVTKQNGDTVVTATVDPDSVRTVTSGQVSTDAQQVRTVDPTLVQTTAEDPVPKMVSCIKTNARSGRVARSKRNVRIRFTRPQLSNQLNRKRPYRSIISHAAKRERVKRRIQLITDFDFTKFSQPTKDKINNWWKGDETELPEDINDCETHSPLEIYQLYGERGKDQYLHSQKNFGAARRLMAENLDVPTLEDDCLLWKARRLQEQMNKNSRCRSGLKARKLLPQVIVDWQELQHSIDEQAKLWCISSVLALKYVRSAIFERRNKGGRFLAKVRDMDEPIPVTRAWVCQHFEKCVVSSVIRYADRSFYDVTNLDKEVKIKIDNRQVQRIRWVIHEGPGVLDKDKNGYYEVEFSDKSRSFIPETTGESHFPQAVVDAAKSRAKLKGNKFFPLPPGAPRDASMGIELINSSDKHPKPRLLYMQRDDPTCLFCSFASALHFVGLERTAKEMADMADMFAADSLNGFHNWKALQVMMRKQCAWLTPKKVKKGFDILGDRSIYPTVVALEAADGCTQHAITIVNDMIFDPNCELALDLNLENLNYCCSTSEKKVSFKQVFHGYRFVIQDGRQRWKNRKLPHITEYNRDYFK